MSARAIEPAANNATPTDATSPAPRSFDIDIVLLLIFLCFPRTTWRSLSCDKHRCVPIAIKRTEPALARNKGNQVRGGRAGGEGATLASSWTCWKSVRDLIAAGATIAPATCGIPWKHRDRQTTMNGHALSEEDLSDEDLAGWHGISSIIPAVEGACTDCSMPFTVTA